MKPILWNPKYKDMIKDILGISSEITITDVIGDGNCAFHSILLLTLERDYQDLDLDEKTEKADKLREEILADAHKFIDFYKLSKNISEELLEELPEREFIGNISIQCISFLIHFNIFVIDISNGTICAEVEFNEKYPNIFLIYHQYHYMPIIINEICSYSSTEPFVKKITKQLGLGK